MSTQTHSHDGPGGTGDKVPMKVPCCPQLVECSPCDVIEMRRRLLFTTAVRANGERPVRVEVILHTRYTRCSGPLTLGDPVYSTTLLPGEKVRLATTDRRSRFSFDSSTSLSYRSEQLSEEQYRMSSFRAAMADQHSTDNGSSSTSSKGAWDFHGDASGSLGFLSASADTNAHGSHNASSTAEYAREHSAQASMADRLAVEATRKAHSVSMGEVSTRTHTEGESEDHYEASSREFSNANRAHAVTYMFYRINKCETIRFELVGIERRVIDQAAPTPLLGTMMREVGQIATIPQEVPATNTARLDTEGRGLGSERLYAANLTVNGLSSMQQLLNTSAGVLLPPLDEAVRKAALDEVDKSLIHAGLLDPATREVSPKFAAEIGFDREDVIPTPGVLVKGCLDECNVAEPELQRQITLELDKLELQNKLLKRQIDLLDKAQEYRCCPAECDHDDDTEPEE